VAVAVRAAEMAKAADRVARTKARETDRRRTVTDMKTQLTTCVLVLCLVTLARAADRPNIVFMMSDDQAWNGLSVPMHPDLPWSKSPIVETPNLERPAAAGMRFSAAYAPASVCSPTRIRMQTGKSSAAMHWTKAAPPEMGRKMIEPSNIRAIPASEVTIG